MHPDPESGERRVESRKSDRAHRSRVPGGRSRRMRVAGAIGCCAAQHHEVQQSAARNARAAERQRCVERGATTNPFSRITFFPLSGRWILFGKRLAATCAVHMRTPIRSDALISPFVPFFFLLSTFFFPSAEISFRDR